ncbi:hypothetical protein IAD21_00896 [Abditibacteriota bacterium]|nr:hypothetical protein IAD21_00896 [Abditibacteriota bacterium]
MDTLIAFGSEIKSFKETPDAYKFEGELIVFDSRDVSRERDRFTKSTEFFTDDGETRPVLYHHGLDPTMGKAKIGSARVFKRDGAVWVEGEIKKRTDYLETHIEHLAAQMKRKVTVKGVDYAPFGLSSGAASHLVERSREGDGHEIKSWPISEISITPTPAEPLTTCGSVKSLEDIEDEYKKFNENQPRDDLGRWKGGSGAQTQHGAALPKKRIGAIAANYGVKPNSKTASVLKEAYDQGHIRTAAQLHNILADSIHKGHSSPALHQAINEHGGGDEPFVASIGKAPSPEKSPDEPQKQDTQLTDSALNYVLKTHGFKPSSAVGKVLKEAVGRGQIATPFALAKILRETDKAGGSVGDLHNMINLHGDGDRHDGKFRATVGMGRRAAKKSDWDDDDLDVIEESDMVAYLTQELVPEEAMASGATGDATKSAADLEYARLQNNMALFKTDLSLRGLSAQPHTA